MTPERKAGLLLARARSALGLSQEMVAAQASVRLAQDIPRIWVQGIEAGPKCPLSNHRRLWALMAVLGVDPADYLEALGLEGRGSVWTE